MFRLAPVARLAALLVLLWCGCGPPKEAADPALWLEGEPGEEPAGDEGEQTSPSSPSDPPATEAECRRAAERSVAIQLETSTPEDPTPGAETRGALVQERTSDCVLWETPRSETICVAGARTPSEMDACSD